MIALLIVGFLLEALQGTFSVIIDLLLIRLVFFGALVVLVLSLLIWRYYLSKMTEELVREQSNINLSIMPIDSLSLL